ncbi:MAG TPA: RHS repeat-associated core domain-containing protein [Marmoricola sp.]|nr:RHS repeat-associated core domain-containing protein [Marmoricola sp.]
MTSAAWSDYDRFVVDASPPPAPTVASSTSPENEWSDQLDPDGRLAFTATSSASDTAKIQYSLDSTTYVSSVAATAGQPVAFTAPKPTDGKHVLNVRAVDKAGNVSAGKAYTFDFGAGAALAQPVENHVTARRIALQLQVDPNLASMLGTHRFQYRRGAADTWKDVPLADVTSSGGATLSSWPATTAPTTTESYWDAAATLAGGGVIDVRADFTGNGSYTAPHTVTVDVNAGQAATAGVGPGSVNLLTGEFSLTDSDASLFGASIGRSYGSRSLTDGTDAGQDGAFGPQWALSGASDYADSSWKAVVKTSTFSVDVQDAEGAVVAFTAGPQGGWTPEPGAEDLTLTGDFTSSFVLTDVDGNRTDFVKPATTPAPPADTWPVASTTPAGAGATARFGYATNQDTGRLRLVRVAAPNPSLTDTAMQACANPATDLLAASARGCRTLELVWATPQGGFTGQRVTAIKAYTWDPAAASGAGAMTATTEVTYAYDSAGRLTSVTNPKPGQTPGGQPLSTAYAYDTTGLLTGLTPPGQQKWTFTYATGPTIAGPTWDRELPTSAGRLVTAARPTLSPGTTNTVNGTATTAIVYGVPVTTAGHGPLDLDTETTGTWGQTVGPVEGAAVYDADASAQPTGDYWAGDDTATRSWSKADITYLDVNGRQVNHISRDGQLDATGYDTDGNEVFSLDGGNRALALEQGPDATATLAALGLQELSTDARAGQLATITGYETGTSGVSRVKYSQGPLRTVVTASGDQDQQRPTSRTSYDQGRPADADTSDLPTTTTTGGLPGDADPETAALDNARTTTTTYDWTLGLPLNVTTDPSPAAGDEITTRTRYDAKGRVTAQQQPADSTGTTAGTRLTSYWGDTGDADCTGHPEWADLVCKTSYAAAITGSTTNVELPVSTTTYNRVGAVTTVTETANGARRTTTTVYDAADRPTAMTVTNTGLGSNPPAESYAYDPATGAVAATSADGKTITTVTDTLGRTLSYTDATGLKTTTTYDALDRPASTTEGDSTAGGVVRSFMTTLGYDAATGRLSGQADPQAGSISLEYDAAGNITTQTFGAAAAGGLTQNSQFDPSGAEVERTWTMTGQVDPVLSELSVENIHGQQVDQTLMPGGHRTYGYDGAGRLTSTTQVDAGQCTVRTYRFDTNSNRIAYASTASAATADASGDLVVCPTPTIPAVSSTFDTGDRITNTGYAYDNFGRITRLPLASAQVERVTYHANDLVAAQTLYTSGVDADANNGLGQNPAATSTYTLDVTGQRFATRTAQDTNPETGAVTTRTRTLRYSSGADAPTWTDEGDGSITRTATGPTGDLTALVVFGTTSTDDSNDQLSWELSDIHGDIAATLPANNSDTIQLDRPDEYGYSVTAIDGSTQYGWLGAKKRSMDTPGNLLLMGLRLYSPVIGRFLSPDPVFGGNANAYTYPTDPVNQRDVDGRIAELQKGGAGCVCFTSNEIGKAGEAGYLKVLRRVFGRGSVRGQTAVRVPGTSQLRIFDAAVRYRNRTIYYEVKANSGRLTAKQRMNDRALRASGYNIRYVRIGVNRYTGKLSRMKW